MQNPPPYGKPFWTILKLLQWATAYFKSHQIETPRIDAEVLLAHVLQKERIHLYACYDQPLRSRELQQFKTLIKKRVERMPIAYITGVKEFWSMDLRISPAVLIPRPETECLVETVLDRIPATAAGGARRILDLGTGSGTIVLALASRLPEDLFFASDLSIQAIRLARQNAKQHELAGRIHFFCGDWMNALRSGQSLFDIIVSNPPYIQSGLIPGLQPEICRYEPLQALDGGKDGLDCLRRIIDEALGHLKAGGWLFLEIGFDQKKNIDDIVAKSGGYDEIVFGKDYSGCDRVVSMRKRG